MEKTLTCQNGPKIRRPLFCRQMAIDSLVGREYIILDKEYKKSRNETTPLFNLNEGIVRRRRPARSPWERRRLDFVPAAPGPQASGGGARGTALDPRPSAGNCRFIKI